MFSQPDLIQVTECPIYFQQDAEVSNSADKLFLFSGLSNCRIAGLLAMISKMNLLKSVIDSHPTVRFLQRKFNQEGYRYSQLSCDDGFDEYSEVIRSPRQERRTNSKDLNKGCFNYMKLPGGENLDPFLGVKKPVHHAKTVHKTVQEVKKVERPIQQDKTNHNWAQEVKIDQKQAQQVETVQNPGQQGETAQEGTSAPVHRPLCNMPSWQGNQRAREKFVQRRTAVCDNIERQLTNENGTSLRKLRKYMVVENVLQEVNLL